MACAGSYFSAWPTTCETVAGVFLPHEHAQALLETDMTASLPESVPDGVASVNLAPTQQVFRHRLEQVIADCIARACECAISTVFSEAAELSVALCTPAGESVVEAGSPIRAGVLGAQVRALLQTADARPLRDLYVVCDPEAGSPSLCSYTLIAPCLGTDESLLGYLAVGAELLEQPASREPSWEPALLPDSENESPLNELPPAVGPRYQMFQASTLPTRLGQVRSRETEGHRLPPTKLTEELLHQLASYGCDPSERLVDFRALVSALELGKQSLRALTRRSGAEAVRSQMNLLVDVAAAQMTARLRQLSATVCAFADSLDDDGTGVSDPALTATLHVRPDQVVVDLQDSVAAVRGPLNIGRAVSLAVVRCAFAKLLPAGAVVNDGSLRPLTVLTRRGSILDAEAPYPLAAGAYETALRLLDVLLGALAQADPKLIPGACAGSVSSVTITGGRWRSREFLAGGLGSSSQQAATSALRPVVLSGRSVPVEVLERSLPVRVCSLGLRKDSGGGGVHIGGNGLRRELLFLSPLLVELFGERRKRPPYGLGGGGPGMCGRDTLRRTDRDYLIPAKASLLVQPGDVLCTETPGGGGHGDPQRVLFFASLFG